MLNRLRHSTLLTLLRSVVVLAGTLLPDTSAVAENGNTFVGSTACVACHSKEHGEWKGSHHEQAMAVASAATVLGNFNNTKFRYNGIVTTFFRRGADYFVNTDGPDGALQDYKIEYTFGVYPLQQYLVKFPDGKMQALSISWDSRSKKDGGQRWFHLYPDEKVDSKDVLHWTKRSQNWNSMCAECHSTNLQKRYDPSTKVFHTTWSEVSVGCEACHGPASAHVAWAGKRATLPATPEPAAVPPYFGFTFSLKREPFIPAYDAKTGKILPNTSRTRSVEPDTCGRCHSRRSVLTETYAHGQPLMATHFPSLLTAGLYHADGQILDEVFEYGSFTQSKMHQSKVACSDCHNPHSLKLRLPGNAVCGQCHTVAKYDSPQHHFHKVGSPGAECKSCHMPEKNYMQVDPRSDHSIRIPSPAQSAKSGAPDACTTCHQDRSSTWAEEQIRKRFGAASPDLHHFGATLAAARAGSPAAAQGLIELVSDQKRPAIVRATAAEELAQYLDPNAARTLAGALSDGSPQVRAAALGALDAAPPAIKLQLIVPLLKDPILGVRIEAARVLSSVPQDQLPKDSIALFERVSVEYLTSQLINAESPQAQVNIGVLNARRGQAEAAEKAYRTAIQLEPMFIPAYVNLADLFRQIGRDTDGIKVLEEAITRVPTSADAYYSLGLLHVRRGEKRLALKELRTASELESGNFLFAYVYLAALQDLGMTSELRENLAATRKRFPNSPQLADFEQGSK